MGTFHYTDGQAGTRTSPRKGELKGEFRPKTTEFAGPKGVFQQRRGSWQSAAAVRARNRQSLQTPVYTFPANALPRTWPGCQSIRAIDGPALPPLPASTNSKHFPDVPGISRWPRRSFLRRIGAFSADAQPSCPSTILASDPILPE